MNGLSPISPSIERSIWKQHFQIHEKNTNWDSNLPEPLSVSLPLEDAAHEELQGAPVQLAPRHLPLAGGLPVQPEHLSATPHRHVQCKVESINLSPTWARPLRQRRVCQSCFQGWEWDNCSAARQSAETPTQPCSRRTWQMTNHNQYKIIGS